MRIAIAGGHGQIARRLSRLLAERGDTPVAIVRNPAHVADVEADGATAVLLDLEDTDAGALAAQLGDADAVVFAAGAGPGSGADRKDTVDRGAAALLADAAEHAGVRRYVLVSSVGAGAEPPAGTDEVFAAYLRAKTAAEDDLRGRALSWTILRPGGLTDDAGTGHVRLGPEIPRGKVPRDDVAAVLLALLDEPRTAGLTLELSEGAVPVAAAIAAALEPED
ncbi:SDR family oxidoreductase [Cellulomonas hominis]|uniref:SDR family oxidoreductase n=1 Tax=Cellulomonas hominis TaxID=156981 RepID=UPI001B97C209|nr:SDR family oxidoreductase [Cellulomonas hominis]VTR77738.1 putative sugar epimerase YhfK [Cellulomonas hominis]